ncbi:putative peptide maturation dehydrogenase [Xanthomonas theicola]|uniref:Putative peptide maturation dehydrogenase n=2 Tax=Xanthomonas theicola TaxID=56464 RepID=A0A2S6ZBR0_9XANT|nr:putative peptide maturation dehydrogenase [Xanthomonas theicola]PPT84519.1 putative peptide maturation dehydrogenase [Xanthomonas theicola]QNH27157.1 putative peptide maturation dehydrogenase [Xanthomonas theicola]
MHIRRCKVLYLEPREDTRFDLHDLLAGGDGLRRTLHWIALAPHLRAEVGVDAEERELLGRLSPDKWVRTKALADAARKPLKRLLRKGLVVAGGRRHAENRARDDALRSVHWHPLAAAFHAFTRWSGTDAVQAMKETGTETAQELRLVLGAPPVEAGACASASSRLPLPRAEQAQFDTLLARRATCRNFDAELPLPYRLFAQLMQRVFAAQGQVRVTEDMVFLKKTSPSGGGLHPVEAYLIVQNVEGVSPGLYHYHCIEHALEPLGRSPGPLPAFALDAVAQQQWFADAHVMVLLVPRYDRSFWKYRRHAKGYRAIVLEAGHLSQTLYLCATEAGLGAYVTAAINEASLERAFGLEPASQGVLAICGFGWRAAEMATMELDPCSKVWA